MKNTPKTPELFTAELGKLRKAGVPFETNEFRAKFLKSAKDVKEKQLASITKTK